MLALMACAAPFILAFYLEGAMYTNHDKLRAGRYPLHDWRLAVHLHTRREYPL